MRLQGMLQLPCGARLLYLLLVLACYQGSLFPAPWGLAGGRAKVGSGVVVGTETCPPSEYQRNLAYALNNMGSADSNVDIFPLYRTKHNLTGTCPPNVSDNTQYIEELSLCPWTLVETVDANRSPRHMFQARCICGGCRGVRPRHRHRMSCVPVYYLAKVIRHVCTPSGFEYQWGSEPVAVGCACAHAAVRRAF